MGRDDSSMRCQVGVGQPVYIKLSTRLCRAFRASKITGNSITTSVKLYHYPLPAMRYGRTLKNSIYPPWRDQYIDYDKLKQLLHDTASDQGIDQEDDDEWTEENEGAFVEELVNVQLEKVAAFQADMSQKLKERTTECERMLEPLSDGPEIHVQDADNQTEARDQQQKDKVAGDDKKKILQDVLKQLDEITKETNELERYSRINFSGFLKAAKKHDRRRGRNYRVRPLLQVRLSALPFNQEDYSPLLYRLSVMYSFVREELDGGDKKAARPFSDSQTGGETFMSYKCRRYSICDRKASNYSQSGCIWTTCSKSRP